LVFTSPVCRVLHGIALAVVSEWCQETADYASPIPLRWIRE
jgi:hypothetical protein